MNDVNVELSHLSNRIISILIFMASDLLLAADNKDAIFLPTSCILDYEFWINSVRLSGLTILFTALLFTVIVIFNNNFHSASTRNNFIIILTLIIISIGVGLLSLAGDWMDCVIATGVASIITILAILLGLNLKDSTRKWMTLLFSLCCLLLVAGIAFFITSVILCNHIAFAVLSLICWCSEMFIVISLTSYYLMEHCKSKNYSPLYMTLVSAFEFIVLLMISQVHVNYFFRCHPHSKPCNH
ncbi:unnamed protein product [Schistosoma turkestanicum]|nr:unnamed protein product [Schistosoma turkestanicum]